jgi:hypothetical protein
MGQARSEIVVWVIILLEMHLMCASFADACRRAAAGWAGSVLAWAELWSDVADACLVLPQKNSTRFDPCLDLLH